MENGFFIWAHRGASKEAPENTLAAFRAAEATGADGIELDVHLSRDGVPVVIHDDSLDRTTSGRGAVNRMRVRDLRRLDAGGWFSPAFAGEPLPTLEEVFTWVGDRLRLNIEIKESAAGRAVLDLAAAFPQTKILISSFDHHLLEDLRRGAPEVPLAFLVDSHFWHRAVSRAAACRAESLNPRHDLVSRPLLTACRRKGLAVFPWTVDEPRRLRWLARMGVDGVFTNDPGTAVRNFRKDRPAAANL